MSIYVRYRVGKKGLDKGLEREKELAELLDDRFGHGRFVAEENGMIPVERGGKKRRSHR